MVNWPKRGQKEGEVVNREPIFGELLESGQFASNVELAEVAGYERSLLAEKLWYLYHDFSEEAREAGYLSCLLYTSPSPRDTR